MTINEITFNQSLNEKGKQLALETRIKLGYSLIEPIDIFKILSYKNISYAKKPMGKPISGILLRYGSSTLLIINSDKALGHQNFAAAHLLYHLFYDKELESRLCHTCMFDENNFSETFADYFALNLLLPDIGVNNQLNTEKFKNELSIENIIHLEQYYSSPHKAMLLKLFFMGKLSKDEAVSLFPQIKNNALSYGYPTTLYSKTKEDIVISDYVLKLNKALKKKIITQEEYDNFLIDVGYSSSHFLNYENGNEDID